ncbi:uncharacterized protein LTR77_009247 [Saxophila tyrrhenica]|uniref:Glutamate-1-semialdehyde 2,1-aminomutase n=1 Tax=Saxophila tyrrhenica TaxID=1690608 RepID=A0AAV9NYJ0_9PEZI|nr:hypothetical protein LTR77_009247 [Saxophila tyrrhenica]
MPSATAEKTYDNLANAFTRNNPKSKTIYNAATNSLPGGNTRSVLYYHPFPLSMSRASGSQLFSVDGHAYIDLLGEYTAGLYGHSEPLILAAITEAAKRGLNYGSQHEDEVRLAELVKQRFPSMDLMRFTNSGTEATLMALAAAKAFTGRKKIVVFDGGYHGGAFTFKDGKSAAVNAPHEWLIARYNDLTSVRALLDSEENAGKVAAILVEPMLGSGGAIPPTAGFLEGLREAATAAGAVLIFDEVMTSRMHSGGGIQSQMPADLCPDMTTLGKYIGGGMSFGAFGGKQAIMELFDPRKPNALQHAGTFNNNVLTMSAGRVGLEQVFMPERASQLHARGDKLRKALQDASRGTLMKITGYGSIMCFHFTESTVEDVRSPQDLKDDDKTLSSIFHLFMLERGYYIARRGFLALSLALTEEQLDGFVEVVREFLRVHENLVKSQSSRARL